AQTVERLLRHYERLLDAALVRPDDPIARLPLATPEEEEQVAEWNRTATPYQPEAVQQLVERQAARTPDAPAVIANGTSLGYRELEARARLLARHLVRSGAVHRPVGLLFEPSSELAVAVLSTLKAGAVCLPLDPTHPRERLSNQLAEAGAPILLSVDGLARRV